jgi:hypothetical protein
MEPIQSSFAPRSSPASSTWQHLSDASVGGVAHIPGMGKEIRSVSCFDGAIILIAIGDITYLTLLGNPMIILNSLKATRDLMNERSSNYSNRPYSAMNEL